MIALLGTIPLGISPLTGPVARQERKKATFAEHKVTRGKPPIQEIGEELDRQRFDFFFCETFCDPEAERARLDAAYATKTPMPLVLGDGGYAGLRYVVDGLDVKTVKTTAAGRAVRIEATIALLENPLQGRLFALISSIARRRAPAVSPRAPVNPAVRR